MIAGGEVEDPIDIEGRGLTPKLSRTKIVRLPGPRDFEVPHIVAVDLIQRGVTSATQFAPIGPPLSVLGAVLRYRWKSPEQSQGQEPVK